MDRRAKDRPGVLPLKTLCERALMANIGHSGAQSGYAPRFNVFEDLMGVSAGPGHHHSSTVIIKEQLRPSATTPAKRKRPESSGDDGGTAAVAAAQGHHPAPLPRPGTKVRSEDLADPGAEDLFRMLSGLH
ncbi:hypothetical protein H4R18_001475 [Coemansia javaensis]|uniref:Uncharacterized protein n=1 Tax=Coemansia javaensis TaxID=2761396 RepID=A0A9W8LKL0_9FUNG|nr:hypothetical protein H4R18_001475 [Coemansia javaensis]